MSDAATVELLVRRLELVYRWYEGMIDPATGTLQYLYAPESDTFIRKRSPIREIASIWDVEVLSAYLRRDTLRPLIERCLRQHSRSLVERDGYALLDAHGLQEPSSIAHSAFMLLALLHRPGAQPDEAMTALADGILRQQRTDGSYKVFFTELPDEGEELYAGEAMLALCECHRRAPNAGYLESVERAFRFYDARYFARGRVTDDLLVFFANWQSQAARLLFEQTASGALKREVAAYLRRMHDRIIELGYYDRVRKHRERQVSVEVACALEGLNDAYAVARAADEGEDLDRYRDCICIGLGYLLDLQCTRSSAAREIGGFGMSFDERMQRIDVTGHAASAFMKAAANRIDCSGVA